MVLTRNKNLKKKFYRRAVISKRAFRKIQISDDFLPIAIKQIKDTQPLDNLNESFSLFNLKTANVEEIKKNESNFRFSFDNDLQQEESDDSEADSSNEEFTNFNSQSSSSSSENEIDENQKSKYQYLLLS